MSPIRSAEGVVAQCLAIADDCAAATGQTAFADGYRAAAEDMRRRIETAFGLRRASTLEREIREVAIEARAVSKVIALLRARQAACSSNVARRALGDAIDALLEPEDEPSVRELDVG